MVSEKEFVDMALAFPGTEQTVHFDRAGFKVIGRRMYASYLAKDHTANVFLSVAEQKVFCKMSKSVYPVPNKWGEGGATTFDLKSVEREVVQEALLSAYNAVVKSNPRKRKS